MSSQNLKGVGGIVYGDSNLAGKATIRSLGDEIACKAIRIAQWGSDAEIVATNLLASEQGSRSQWYARAMATLDVACDHCNANPADINAKRDAINALVLRARVLRSERLAQLARGVPA